MPNGALGLCIPLRTLKELESKNFNFKLNLETPYGIYQLPVNLVSVSPEITELLSKNGVNAANAAVSLIIRDKTADKSFLSSFALTVPKGRIIGSAIEFTAEIVRLNEGNTAGNKIGSYSGSNEPVTILMPATQQTMPQYWGVYKYDEVTMRYNFVPHTLELVNGTPYAAIQTASNGGVYFAAENAVTFIDIPADQWYSSYVLKAASKRLVQGVGGDRFEPDRSITRAEFIQMMMNALELPKAKTGTAGYSDVTSGMWHYEAVMRAKSAGLLDKFTGSIFNPNVPITREEISAIIAAAARRAGLTANTASVNLAAVFSDYPAITSYFAADVDLVYRLEIMQGVGGNQFNPKGTTTRAQAATVQIRLLETLLYVD
jgi:hypothetical protein